MKSLLDSVVEPGSYEFMGIKAQKGYRNKMEFSFGDEVRTAAGPGNAQAGKFL